MTAHVGVRLQTFRRPCLKTGSSQAVHSLTQSRKREHPQSWVAWCQRFHCKLKRRAPAPPLLSSSCVQGSAPSRLPLLLRQYAAQAWLALELPPVQSRRHQHLLSPQRRLRADRWALAAPPALLGCCRRRHLAAFQHLADQLPALLMRAAMLQAAALQLLVMQRGLLGSARGMAPRQPQQPRPSVPSPLRPSWPYKGNWTKRTSMQAQRQAKHTAMHAPQDTISVELSM